MKNIIKFLLLYSYVCGKSYGQYTLRGVPESYAVIDKNYRLQCDVTDSPSGVDFNRNNDAVCSIISSVCLTGTPPENRYKCGCINNNNKQLYLNISNINKQDDTTWSCTGYDGLQGSTTVPVYFGPDELTFSPDVTSINIIEGRDQAITCLTDCYECNYKWTGPVSSSTKDLVLTQINRTQEGNYTCEATNIKNTNPKTRSKSIQVNVHYPPDIKNITSNAVNNETDEGSDVIFNCNVDSKPISTITWSSSTSTDTYTGQQKTLTQVKCQDTGIYTCTANNGIGQSTTKSIPLNIRCSPRINGDLKEEVKNRLGEEVTLVIDVIAYPKPSFKWIQESGQELTSDPPQQVSTNNYISRLTLTLQQSSFGNYTVTVTNDIGDDKSYTIKIIDGEPDRTPVPQSELNIPAVVGGIIAAVVVITLVIIAVIVIKRRRNSAPDSPTTSPKNQRLEIIPNDLYESSDVVGQRSAHDNPAVEILENDLYAGSDDIFGKNPDVPKANNNENEGGIFSQSNKTVPKAEPVYGQVNKPKKPKATKKKEPKKPPKPDKPPPVPGKIGEDQNNEGVYQNAGAIGKQKNRNVEGLNYADVVFSNKKPNNKIKGKKEETLYVEIDPNKRGKPLPPEDSD